MPASAPELARRRGQRSSSHARAHPPPRPTLVSPRPPSPTVADNTHRAYDRVPDLTRHRGQRSSARARACRLPQERVEIGAHPRRRCSPGVLLVPREIHSMREMIHFYLSSVLRMQNARCFASSVGATFGEAQCRGGGIYAFACARWTQSNGTRINGNLMEDELEFLI
jgi:hypothetical protein